MVDDDFPSDATAAFDKLAALKRRYQNDADPFADAELMPAAEIESADTEDIPVLTEAVLIAETPTAEPSEASPLPISTFEQRIVDLIIEQLRPELNKLLEQAVVNTLLDRGPEVYDAWLKGLRQRTNQTVQELPENLSSGVIAQSADSTQAGES